MGSSGVMSESQDARDLAAGTVKAVAREVCQSHAAHVYGIPGQSISRDSQPVTFQAAEHLLSGGFAEVQTPG